MNDKIRSKSLRTTAVMLVAGFVVQTTARAQDKTPPPPPAPATTSAQAPDTGLAEVVVTAQRTSEKLVRIPLAVTAVSGGQLAVERITNVAALTAAVPNFNFGTYGGTARLAIRGVGFDSISPGAEGRVAYYVDDVYYSRPATAATGFFDIARVEVLRGPQGTLYGRNATGGALNITSESPTQTPQGYYTQTIGNYNSFTEEGAVSGPLSDKLSGRLAFRLENRDGYGRNTLTGHDVDDAGTQSARAKIKYEPTSALTLLFSADYHREHDRDFAAHYGGQAYPAIFPVATSTLVPVTDHGAPAPANIRDVASQTDPFNHREFWGGGLTATYVGAVTLKSITAYRHSEYQDRFNLSPGDSYGLTLSERASQFSQEFQLSGKVGDLRWVTGLYGFHEEVRGSVDIPTGVGASQAVGIPVPSNPTGFTQGFWAGGADKTDTVALFGQATYAIGPQLELTLGGRVGYERKTAADAQQLDLFDPYVRPNPVTTLPPPSVSPFAFYENSRGSTYNTAFTPKASLAYRPSSDVNLYATVAKGTKSGGFDLGATAPAFKPETLWDYEAGIKAELFERRLRVSLAAFYYDYSNLQVSLVKDNVVFTENAATAHSDGVEGELEAIVTHGLKLKLDGGYLDARFDHYLTSDPSLPGSPVVDYKGNRLSQSPAFQGKAGAEYTFDVFGGEIALRGDVDYSTRVYFTPFDIQPASQAAVARENASLDYTAASGRWHAGVFVRNLSDETVVSASTVSSVLTGLPLVTYLAPPRTFGATLGVRF